MYWDPENGSDDISNRTSVSYRSAETEAEAKPLDIMTESSPLKTNFACPSLNVLDVLELLLAELLQVPGLLVIRDVLVHGRVEEERAVLDLDLHLAVRDISDGLLQLALPDVAPGADLRASEDIQLPLNTRQGGGDARYRR